MKVQIRRTVPEAVIPEYAHASDAGLDLVATSKEYDEMGNVVYGTGLAMEIPEGHVGLLFPRSSNAKKTLWLTNHVGIIDSNFRGEIKCKFRSSLFTVSWWTKLLNWLGLTGINFTYCACEEYEIGDRIGQLIIMPYPKIEFEEVDWLTPSDRSEGSYGSTGR